MASTSEENLDNWWLVSVFERWLVRMEIWRQFNVLWPCWCTSLVSSGRAGCSCYTGKPLICSRSLMAADSHWLSTARHSCSLETCQVTLAEGLLKGLLDRQTGLSLELRCCVKRFYSLILSPFFPSLRLRPASWSDGSPSLSLPVFSHSHFA